MLYVANNGTPSQGYHLAPDLSVFESNSKHTRKYPFSNGTFCLELVVSFTIWVFGKVRGKLPCVLQVLWSHRFLLLFRVVVVGGRFDDFRRHCFFKTLPLRLSLRYSYICSTWFFRLYRESFKNLVESDYCIKKLRICTMSGLWRVSEIWVFCRLVFPSLPLSRVQISLEILI